MAIQDWLRNNSQGLTQAGVGLLSGRTGPEQFALGAQGFAQGQQQNKTAQYIEQNFPELGQAVKAGVLTPADAFKMATEARTKKVDPKAGLMSVGKAIYNASTGEWITPPAGVGGADDTEYGLNPQYGTDANGNPVILQLSKGGTSKQTMLPEGIQLSKEPIKLDAGTHFVLLDPITRQPVGQIPKDLAGAEAQKVLGKGQGEAGVSYESMNAKIPGLEKVVQDLGGLADKATYTTSGRLLDAGMKELGMDPRDAAVARAEYIAKVDNQVLPLLRDTFGSAFTQKEGETLRATLGDPDKSPAEKKAVLNAFIEQKKRDVQAMAQQAGIGGGSQINRTTTGTTWKVK